MNESHKYNLIYFHIPKCAGVSVRRAIGIDKTKHNGLFENVSIGFAWNSAIHRDKAGTAYEHGSGPACRSLSCDSWLFVKRASYKLALTSWLRML